MDSLFRKSNVLRGSKSNFKEGGEFAPAMDEYNDQNFHFPSQMVRPPKSSEPSKKKKTNLPANPEKSERNRLKSLAISSGILSVDPSGSESWLGPSRTVLKHDGRDIVKKSQRKNRFLFAFPGLIGPSGGGRIGQLKDLGTKNPILYLEFPQVLLMFPVRVLYLVTVIAREASVALRSLL